MAVRDYPRQPQASSWLEDKRLGRILSFVVIPLLIIAALLLPPISLVQRIQDMGATQVTEAGGVIRRSGRHAGHFRARHGQRAVPCPPFLRATGQLPRRQRRARTCWQRPRPSRRRSSPKSPYYQLDLRGQAPSASTWVVPIPNDSEPYETLDVYTWENATPALAMAAAQHHQRRRPGGEPARRQCRSRSWSCRPTRSRRSRRWT